MSKQSYKPADFATLSPYLTVKNVQQSIDFYQKAFGFSMRGEADDEASGEILHAEMAFGDATLMIGQEGAFGNDSRSPASSKVASPVCLYVYCPDVDALFTQATATGAEVVMPCQTMFWGDRMCRLKDKDGHEWCFATNIGEHMPKPEHTHGHGCC
jgi:uncharacterized glyoxalase superfamily protein PhnB